MDQAERLLQQEISSVRAEYSAELRQLQTDRYRRRRLRNVLKRQIERALATRDIFLDDDTKMPSVGDDDLVQDTASREQRAVVAAEETLNAQSSDALLRHYAILDSDTVVSEDEESQQWQQPKYARAAGVLPDEALMNICASDANDELSAASMTRMVRFTSMMTK